MSSNFHSVTLDQDRCIGCTDCIKRCPTEAIRVRQSKAQITDERCIDCAMCIRICRNNAKKGITDSLSKIETFEYKVAIPAPTLYAQFKNITNPNLILTGLKKIGFDEVFEVSKAAEIITEYTKKQFQNDALKKPLISSACPVIVKLIQMRFPSLIPNIMPAISPKEAIARYAKNYLVKQGIKEESIGVFFISPCAAKLTESRAPETIHKSYVDGVISIKDVYLKLIPVLKTIEVPETLLMSSTDGVSWASIGGESKATKIENQIAVDGIENVIKILERIEDGKLEVDFLECLACTNGCLGGPLTVEDSFVANNKMEKVKKYINEHSERRNIDIYDETVKLDWDIPLKTKLVHKLDENMDKALEKIERLEMIYETLPQIDCGSCGAPTCRALAEDIVRDRANIEDCVFMLRMKVRSMSEDMRTLAEKMPSSISRKHI